MTKYAQGRYKPKNKEKYKGDIDNIWYRSGWELTFFIWLDHNESILEWSSEEVIIPYLSPIDNKYHRYFVDAYAKIQTNDGVKEFLIEIKPKKELQPPKKPKRQSKAYLTKAMKYAVNRSKWDCAIQYCEENGMTFKILTEDELFGKNKR